jgi:hypothetical protein
LGPLVEGAWMFGHALGTVEQADIRAGGTNGELPTNPVVRHAVVIQIEPCIGVFPTRTLTSS